MHHFLDNMKYGHESRSRHDGGQQSVCQSLDSQSSRRRQADSDRSRIAVFTAQCPHQQDGNWKRYTRAEEESISRFLIETAKANGLFIDIKETMEFGSIYSKKTGESHVYANEELGLVFKVYNPFAKRVLKDLHPIDAIYEHIIHNILFPNARYTFVGISSEYEEARIVLSQDFCMAQELPSEQEIETHLLSIGLLPEDSYYFGNDYLSVTDISSKSDNVLKDNTGTIYFIDPIIKLKKPAPLVIDWLLSNDSPLWNHEDALEFRRRKASWLSRLLTKVFRK